MTQGRERRPAHIQGTARLVLVDDHDVARASLRKVLNQTRGLEVVAEAANGNDALDVFQRLRPDLMLVDVHMPGSDGLAVTRAIKDQSPSTRVLLISLDASPGQLLEALKSGADGYIAKGVPNRVLVQAVRQVLSGRPMLQPDLAAYLLEIVDSDKSTTILSEPLTPAELEVVRLSIKGRSPASIARELGLAPVAVSKDIRRILTKLGVVKS